MNNPILAAMQGTATRNALNNPRISNLVRLFKSGFQPSGAHLHVRLIFLCESLL